MALAGHELEVEGRGESESAGSFPRHSVGRNVPVAGAGDDDGSAALASTAAAGVRAVAAALLARAQEQANRAGAGGDAHASEQRPRAPASASAPVPGPSPALRRGPSPHAPGVRASPAKRRRTEAEKLKETRLTGWGLDPFLNVPCPSPDPVPRPSPGQGGSAGAVAAAGQGQARDSPLGQLKASEVGGRGAYEQARRGTDSPLESPEVINPEAGSAVGSRVKQSVRRGPSALGIPSGPRKSLVRRLHPVKGLRKGSGKKGEGKGSEPEQRQRQRQGQGQGQGQPGKGERREEDKRKGRRGQGAGAGAGGPHAAPVPPKPFRAREQPRVEQQQPQQQQQGERQVVQLGDPVRQDALVPAEQRRSSARGAPAFAGVGRGADVSICVLGPKPEEAAIVQAMAEQVFRRPLSSFTARKAGQIVEWILSMPIGLVDDVPLN